MWVQNDDEDVHASLKHATKFTVACKDNDKDITTKDRRTSPPPSRAKHPSSTSFAPSPPGLESSFMDECARRDIIIEAKGRFWDHAEYSKYVWIRKSLPEKMELVFVFQKPYAPMPAAKKRTLCLTASSTAVSR